MSNRSILFAACLLFVLSALALPYPSAVYKPNTLNNDWGNMYSAEAMLDIKMFEATLLKDPAGAYYPWKRQVLHVSSFGAVANDKKDDWDGLNNAIQTACGLSSAKMANYTTMTTKYPSMSKMPSYPARPVLVELRWDKNGEYDLGQGLWYPWASCQYVLFNGQNSTIVTHREAGFPLRGFYGTDGGFWDTNELFPIATNNDVRYLYNFNFAMSRPSTTIGHIVNLVTFPNGTVYAMDLVAIPLHVSFNEPVKTIVYQPVNRFGDYNLYERSVSTYGGYSGQVSSSTPNKVGGIMRLTLNYKDFQGLGITLEVGGYIGIARDTPIDPGSYFSVVLDVNMCELGGHLGSAPWNVDFIDVHIDRLNHLLFQNGGVEKPLAQITTTGTLRLWHTSFDGSSDDDLDNTGFESTVVSVDIANSKVHIQDPWGGINAGGGTCPSAGSSLAFARYPSAMEILFTVTSTGCQVMGSGNTSYGLLGLSPMPALQAGDVMFNLESNPVLLHVKNFRGGNHQYSTLNIKAQTLIVEKSFFYNTTFAGLELSPDTWIWHEGNPMYNLTISDNIFQYCGVAFFVFPSVGPDWGSLPAPACMKTAVIANNYVLHNSSSSNRCIGMYLSSMNDLTFKDNTMVVVPGSDISLPLIITGSLRNSVFSGNVIQMGKSNPSALGVLCQNGQCPEFPVNRYIGLNINCKTAPYAPVNVQYINNTFGAPTDYFFG